MTKITILRKKHSSHSFEEYTNIFILKNILNAMQMYVHKDLELPTCMHFIPIYYTFKDIQMHKIHEI